MAAVRHSRLELARGQGRPHGDSRSAWNSVAALDETGRLGLAACRATPARRCVGHFVRDAPVPTRQLSKGRDGNRLLELGPDEFLDDAGRRLKGDRFIMGEVVAILSPNGVRHAAGIARLQSVGDYDPETVGPFDR